ncbi:hypothetical protein Fcan01_17254 [Folsomia candida]|uniref:Uncharacterized protein n=1 Tax=Folsomia candida TaxID=158441 RepID=A0A226DRY3_FOLCA|nr:hypothetical protein Fcan01_17254 [Folsomia candida]
MNDTGVNLDCSHIKVLFTIKTVQISEAEDISQRFGNSSIFRPFLQQVINKSPNLEELIIGENFYPILTKCSKLRCVDWKGFPYEMVEEHDVDEDVEIRADFSLNNVFTMLEEVNPSLEKLVLGSSGSYLGGDREAPVVYQVNDFKLSKFPKLREFNLDAANIYDIGFKTLTSHHILSIKKLRLKEDIAYLCDRYHIDNLIDLSINCSSVEQLTIEKLVVDLQAVDHFDLSIMSKCFPNLKVLDITIVTTSITEPANKSIFKDCLNTLANCFNKLEHLIMRLDWKLSHQQLIFATSLSQFNENFEEITLQDLLNTICEEEADKIVNTDNNTQTEIEVHCTCGFVWTRLYKPLSPCSSSPRLHISYEAFRAQTRQAETLDKDVNINGKVDPDD